MKRIRMFLASILFIVLFIHASLCLAQTEWVNINGTITYNDTPVCAMVLANGQYMFTCGDSLGEYDLEVPLDGNGMITLYGFCSGFSPFKTVLTPSEALGFDIAMTRAGTGSREIEIELQTETGTTNPNYVRISGTVTSDGTPVCAMILANGQNMFSCGDNLGEFDLEVPLDGNGMITLHGFCSGFAPYKKVFMPGDLAPGLWSGLTDEGLEISLIVNDDADIARIDLIYQESDGDYNSAAFTETLVGPFMSGNDASFEIEETRDIDGEDVDVSIVINTSFITPETASGTIEITEGETSYNINFELEWVYDIPTTGPVRDGDWAFTIIDPIIVSTSFDVIDGIATNGFYVVIDASRVYIGWFGLNDPANIGDSLEFGFLSDAVEITVEFTGFMEAEATAVLDLTSGEEQVPMSFEWSPLLP